jgi:uncharacterized protein (UPF0276 family)
VNSQLWILDGWSREEAVEGLKLNGHNEEMAERVYNLCGGNIRDMKTACRLFEPDQNRKA